MKFIHNSGACFVANPCAVVFRHFLVRPWLVVLLVTVFHAWTDDYDLSITGSWPGPVNQPAQYMATAGNRVLMVINEKELLLVELGEDPIPRLLSHYRHDVEIRRVLMHGQKVLLEEATAQIGLLDYSDPSRPVFRSRAPHSVEFAADMIAQGDFVYLASALGLSIFDLTNPDLIYQRTFLDLRNDFRSPRRLGLVGGKLYLGAEIGGYRVFDVTDPDDPIEGASYYTSARLRDMKIVGTRGYFLHYVLFSDVGELAVLDLSGPTPATLGSYRPTATVPFHHALVNETTVTLVSKEGVANQVDLSNPSTPLPLGSTVIPSDAQQTGSHAHSMLTLDGLGRFTVTDLSVFGSPNTLFQNRQTYNSVDVVGDTAYVGGSGTGLRIIDLTSPTQPQQIGALPGTWDIQAVDVDGGIACLAANDAGLLVLGVSAPTSPTLRASFPTPGWARSVVFEGQLAIVGVLEIGLQIVDLAVPGNPALRSTIAIDRLSEIACVRKGDLLYVAFRGESETGFQIYDISDPNLPQLLGSLPLEFGGREFLVAGTAAIIWDNQFTLQVIDVTDPENPVVVGATPTDPPIAALTGNGRLALAFQEFSALSVVDWSNPGQPRSVATIQPPSGLLSAQTVADWKLAMVGTFGLLTGELRPRFEITLPANALQVPGKATVRVRGPSGFAVLPQVSSDLKSWQTNAAQILPPSGEVAVEFDTPVEPSAQFYKVSSD